MKLIKDLREKQGLSLRSLAKKMHKPPALLAEIEIGLRIPGPYMLLNLAKILGHKEELFRSADRLEPELDQKIVENLAARFLALRQQKKLAGNLVG